jgi:chitinase
VTVTDIHQTVITVTSCSENKCHATPVTTGYVVVTDLHTVYTTYCPLTNSEVVVPVKTATVKSTTIATESCSTTATTAGANKEVVTEASAAPATTTTTAKGAEYPKTVAAGSTTTITTTKDHKEEQGVATTTKAAESSSTGAPAPVVVVSSSAVSSAPAPASASGVVVVSSAVPVGTSAGETIYTTIEVTSTTAPYPIPTSVVSAHNGTYGAGNGTAPVVTYEGAAAGVNGLNSAWFTLPLMLAALAF